jgi:hypothetical protein
MKAEIKTSTSAATVLNTITPLGSGHNYTRSQSPLHHHQHRIPHLRLRPSRLLHVHPPTELQQRVKEKHYPLLPYLEIGLSGLRLRLGRKCGVT